MNLRGGWEIMEMYIPVMVLTECPKIYLKSVLHLFMYTKKSFLKQMQYRFAVNFGTLSKYHERENY